MDGLLPPPEASQRLVCNACLGSNWSREVFRAIADERPQTIAGVEWACGDCGSHKARFVTPEGLDRLKAQREEATT